MKTIINKIAIIIATISGIGVLGLVYLIYIEPTIKNDNTENITTTTIKSTNTTSKPISTTIVKGTTTTIPTTSNLTTTVIGSTTKTTTKPTTVKTTAKVQAVEKTTTASHMSTVTINGKTTFGAVASDSKGNIISYELDCKKFNLPTYLADYDDYFYYQITYYYTSGKISYTANEIKSVKVMDSKTKKQITDLSKNNLEKLYNPEVSNKPTEKSWQKEIKLSTLKAGQIYSFKATTKVTEPPKVINDLGKNVKLSIKTPTDDNYEEEYSVHRMIDSGLSFSSSYEEYEVGDTFNIMYTVVTVKEIVDNTDENDIVFISDYPNKGEIDYTFKDYIYNDTSKAIKLRFKDSFYGQEYNEVFTINAGEIVGFNWMMDSIEFE